MDLKRVSPDEAKRLIDEEGYKILDVRSMPEYVEGHPDGAYNIPFLHKTPQGMIPNQDFSRVLQFSFPDPETKLITTCQMGGRSVRAATELMNQGYKNVIDMRGGYGSERDESGNVVNAGWVDSGLPTEDGEPDDRSYKSLNNKANQARRAEQEAVKPAEVEKAPETPANDPNDAFGGELSPGAVRFASSKRRVHCVKMNKDLPGLKRRPYPGPLGERLFKEISAEGWVLWVEHSKMLINEYRINPSDPSAMKLLMDQCEQFFYGDGGTGAPEGYVPQA